MLKYLFILLLLSQAVFAQKISVDERRKRILNIVEEELSEASRLAKQQEYKSPDTLLRMSELFLEKARLWREMENEQYLSIPPEKRRGLNKNSYFKRSNSYFESANKYALNVAKKFPRYKGMGDVYYILAYNYKELGRNNLAKKYFGYSVKKAPANTKIASKAKLALADYHYNDNQFKQAVPLYEASINKVDERWWTKDAFNLAWSYYRIRKYDKAINLMREIHQKSANNKYIDMRSMVERDIGIFYVDAGKINDAVKFYKSIGLKYNEQFIKIANSIMAQGRFTQAESLLAHIAKTEKSRDRKIEILLAQLNLYDKFKKTPPHYAASKELVSMHQQKPLGRDEFKTLVYHVNKQAAELQKDSTSPVYKTVLKVRRRKARESIAYFELAAVLSPNEKAEKVFFQGETSYAARLYTKALGFYITAFDTAKATKNSKIMSQSLEGMLSSLGQKSLNAKTAEKNYVPVYSRYLSVDSKSKRARSIYVKLFNSQFDAKDIAGAEKIMGEFAKNFPKHFKTQEAMLAKVMEHYRSQKDYQSVKNYVVRINQGEFQVSKKYADALRSLMTKIQIEGVQSSLERGDKGVALQGYHKIYESPESTANAKINAAYNLSALYYELGDSNQSYAWGVKAVKDMKVKDVTKFADSFLSISSGLFLRQNFAQSADLSYRLLAKLCKVNSSNKVVSYKNAVFISLANGDLDKALEIRDFGKSCMIPDVTISEVSIEILKDLAKEKRWENYEKLISDLERNSRNYPHLIIPFEDLRVEFTKIGNTTQAVGIEAKQTKFFNQSKAQKLDIPVEALDLMSSRMLASVIAKKANLDRIQLSFPEASFNNAVKAKLQILDQLTNEVNEIQKLGSGKGIVEAYRYVIAAYEEFGTSLKSFAPEGKSPEYVASFQKAMADVYVPILQNANKLRSEIKTLISENKILSETNFYVLYPTESQKRYVTSKGAVLMERGGKR
jgi:tetratricopeptide (TPR) repeat protein